MKTLGTAIFALGVQLTVGVAYCLPPDQVHNSPVPPLQEPAPQPGRGGALAARRAAQPTPQTPAPPEIEPAPGVAVPAEPGATLTPAPAAAASPGEQPGYAAPTAEELDEQRAAIWGSPEMREAIEWVLDYSRRSAQTSESEGRAFLTQLSQLPAPQMQNWLERYRTARMRRGLQQAVEGSARQLMLEHAVSRQEQTWRAFDNINQYQSRAADWMQQRFQTQAQLSQQLRNGRADARDATINEELAQDFDPFLPIFDPSSPSGRRARAGAAATLPGDLPRSDPRNFLRGDEGFLTDNQGDNVGSGAGGPDANSGAGAGAAGGAGGADTGAGGAAGAGGGAGGGADAGGGGGGGDE